jgi:hypothetical protein
MMENAIEVWIHNNETSYTLEETMEKPVAV